jgi:uncharacterized protein with HEPN domain
MGHVQGVSKDAFKRDETLQRAFARSLEIIGEAAKHVPDAVKQGYSHIEWRAIAGMRDKLVHDYFGVDYDLVWDVVINEVPTLREEILQIIRAERAE